jgi:hypothetical protein
MRARRRHWLYVLEPLSPGWPLQRAPWAPERRFGQGAAEIRAVGQRRRFWPAVGDDLGECLLMAGENMGGHPRLPKPAQPAGKSPRMAMAANVVIVSLFGLTLTTLL